METYCKTQDGIALHYHLTETKPTAIVFVHGWLGNANWWNQQEGYFKNTYTVVRIDLPGHGASGRGREQWSSAHYAMDIKEVVDHLESESIVLVGHSMSGPYALEASLLLPKVKLVVLVDTLKDMEHIMDYQQAEELLFKPYREDFKHAVENLLPRHLFAASTPVSLRAQLQREFLRNEASFAVQSIEPLYRMDSRTIAKQVRVPVRAINSDLTPTHGDSIRKYIADFAFVTIPGSGHYPMLERPHTFNQLLNKILQQTGL